MAGKRPQILKLSPQQEISFHGPFTGVVTSYLELQNPSTERVLFKVKTTAPRRYCVRPNSGLIEPGNSTKIAIMLQPSDLDSPTERSRHKFMVQSVVIQDDRASGFDQIWSEVSQSKTHEIMDSKLRCVFVGPEQAQQQHSGAPEAAIEHDIISSAAQHGATPKSTNATSAQPQQQASNTSSTSKNESSSSRPHLVAQLTESASTGLSKIDETESITSSRQVRSRRDVQQQQQQKQADTSLKSSTAAHSISTSSSILQPINDDYKIVLVSLAMLFLGVILGKYII